MCEWLTRSKIVGMTCATPARPRAACRGRAPSSPCRRATCLRARRRELELALVLVRQERAADHLASRKVDANTSRLTATIDAAVIERPLQAARVARVDPAVERCRRAWPPPVRPQQARAEHRRQRQADEQRHHDGERHREAERIDEPLGVAGHERDRQEDHDQRQRRRDDRERDFAGAVDRRLERRQRPPRRCAGRCSPAPRSHRRSRCRRRASGRAASCCSA